MPEKEFPKENELVLVIIKKIMPYGAFCALTEYNNTEAFLHVSEVAPRWIKNIHEFLSGGKRAVAKVLRIDVEKKQIDLSLKRVSESERRDKLEAVKRYARLTNLLQISLAKSKTKLTVKEVLKKISEIYEEPYTILNTILEEENALEKVKLPEKIKEDIIEVVRKSIKKARVSVKKEISLQCFGSNGIEHIKKILAINEPETEVHYLGAPRYKIEVFSADYKSANKKMEKILARIESNLEKDCLLTRKKE